MKTLSIILFFAFAGFGIYVYIRQQAKKSKFKKLIQVAQAALEAKGFNAARDPGGNLASRRIDRLNGGTEPAMLSRFSSGAVNVSTIVATFTKQGAAEQPGQEVLLYQHQYKTSNGLAIKMYEYRVIATQNVDRNFPYFMTAGKVNPFATRFIVNKNVGVDATTKYKDMLAGNILYVYEQTDRQVLPQPQLTPATVAAILKYPNYEVELFNGKLYVSAVSKLETNDIDTALAAVSEIASSFTVQA